MIESGEEHCREIEKRFSKQPVVQRDQDSGEERQVGQGQQ